MAEAVQLNLLDDLELDDLSFGEWMETLPPIRDEPEAENTAPLEEAA